MDLVDKSARLSGSSPPFPRKLRSSNKLRTSPVPIIQTGCQTAPLRASATALQNIPASQIIFPWTQSEIGERAEQSLRR